MDLHIHQTRAIKASLCEKVPFVLMLSGVQGGKTTGGAAWSNAQISERPKGDGLILAPTYKILQQSTLRKFDTIRPKGWAKFNKAEASYTTAWGGKIWVRSTEDPDAMEGITADWVWGDEAGKMPVRAWDNIQGRRSATQGPVFLTTTPYGINWLKTRFYDFALQGRKEYRVVEFRSIDSPHFSREEWDRAKRDLDPKVFARKYGGSFTRLEGLIYESFDPDQHAIPSMPSVPPRWEKIGGIDWGYAPHPFAAGIWASPNFRNPMAPIYKVGEFKRCGNLNSENIKALKDLQTRTGLVSRWYADPSNPQSIKEFRDAGLKITAANNAVDWGIEQVTRLIRTDRIRVVRVWCPMTLDEFATYHRDEKDRIVKTEDHLMDADRYALASHLAPPRRVEIL